MPLHKLAVPAKPIGGVVNRVSKWLSSPGVGVAAPSGWAAEAAAKGARQQAFKNVGAGTLKELPANLATAGKELLKTRGGQLGAAGLGLAGTGLAGYGAMKAVGS